MTTKNSRFPALSLAAVAMLAILNAKPSTALAQGTTAFTYQGRLVSGTNVANSVYDFRFAVYDSTNLPGTLIAGPVTNAATVVTNGYFLATLDFGAGVFTGDARWLDISVRTNGAATFTGLTPRQQITPTPYAITANSANNLLGTLPAAQLSGSLPLAQLPPGLLTNGASGVSISGAFAGNGAGLTNLNLTLNSDGAIVLTNGIAVAASPVVGSMPFCLVAADVNGDGWVDIICVTTNMLTVLTNNGSGAFGTASTQTIDHIPNWFSGLTAADVNGDGQPDLICANTDNTLTVLTNNGGGGFATAATLPVGSNPVSVTAADVNGDGKPDLICANAGDNTLTVLTNSGSGGFATAATLPVGSHPFSVTAADVNGDGKPDLICANGGDNTLTVLTNGGSGGFATAATLPVGSLPISVTAADVTGDGKPDLICANFDGNTLTVLTNSGSGGFATAATLPVGSHPFSVTAADVNGDGKPDLICANFDDNTLTVLLNYARGQKFWPLTSQCWGHPFSVVPADINGDGKVDLVCSIANTNGSFITVMLNEPFIRGYGGVFDSLTVSADDTSSYADAKQIVIRGFTDSNQQLEIGYKTSGNYGVIQAIQQGTGYRPLALQPLGGNVGIGTTSPGYPLAMGGAHIAPVRNGRTPATGISRRTSSPPIRSPCWIKWPSFPLPHGITSPRRPA